ncbi:hypothetical protein COLO4_04778 [Corchorus olitorius]|uniref:Uncharacterized protein n=1 Tax=Corchorus olitorius TaxID=93759 RepID=A0A1R3KSU5_9ROSI|nr:hypothetical protein COLO4_04778 [Corchorus olitorius]
MSEEGKNLGLIDAIASPEELVETSCNLALDIAENRKPRLYSLSRTDKLESSKTEEILQGFRQQAEVTALTSLKKLPVLMSFKNSDIPNPTYFRL